MKTGVGVVVDLAKKEYKAKARQMGIVNTPG